MEYWWFCDVCRILVVWLQVWCMWLMHLCVHSHMNEHHDCVQNTAIFSVYEELEFLLYKIVSKWPWRLCTMAVEAVLVVMPLVLIYALSSNIRVMSEYFSIFLMSKCLRNASFEGIHDFNYVFYAECHQVLMTPMHWCHQCAATGVSLHAIMWIMVMQFPTKFLPNQTKWNHVDNIWYKKVSWLSLGSECCVRLL
jgi:hypothetical protein